MIGVSINNQSTGVFMKIINKLSIFALCATNVCIASASANDQSAWYLRPTLSVSQLSNQNAQVSDLAALSGGAGFEFDRGFAAGLSVGYQYTPNWSAELAWEYRSNDSSFSIQDLVFEEGDTASNVFYLNGRYAFSSASDWTPYVGAGIAVTQEIDVDIQVDGEERSFSSSGDVGFQLFGGLSYKLNDRWSAQGELRLVRFAGIDFESESGAGRINDLAYEPMTLQISARYHF